MMDFLMGAAELIVIFAFIYLIFLLLWVFQ